MRVLFINAVCGTGSTGKICVDLAKKYEEQGDEVKVAYGRYDYVPEQYKKYAVRIGNSLDVKYAALHTRITDRHGFANNNATRKFLDWAEEYNPDVLWLHNIHGYYINIKMLFDWIKSRPQMKIQWTLHDCWAFTGHCAYFSAVGCEKWKKQCCNCEQKGMYPASKLMDNSKKNFKDKKRIFTGIPNVTLITPSEWLANLVKKSFLRDYPVEVRYNEIDTTVFKKNVSDFRERYKLENKKIILGVASVWDERKGLDDFIALSRVLDDRYIIVLVGLDEKQIIGLPNNILGLKRTNNATELAEIYTAADIFVNPSKEETFGMTTIEAQACGTQAIVYSDTACEEIALKYGGHIVPFGDVEAIYKKIIEVI